MSFFTQYCVEEENGKVFLDTLKLEYNIEMSKNKSVKNIRDELQNEGLTVTQRELKGWVMKPMIEVDATDTDVETE